ncbi:MAG: hypothetical protein ACE5IY_10755 [bacterium]
MKAETNESKRGFTTPEKWVIWGVFCLLVGLSTSRLTVFAGLMLLSVGISFVAKKQHIVLAIFLCVAGALNLVFSKFLI